MLAAIGHVTFEENEERLKVILPLRQNWLLLSLFTVSLLIWVVMFVSVLAFIFRDVLPERERYTFVLTVMMLVWLAIWYYLGRLLWRRWQYYAANREILLVHKDMLIVRRPVSILGVTNAYDMQYVNPFYYSDKHHCPAFDYGSQHVYFGLQLAEGEAHQLITTLNGRYFPDHDEE